MHHSFDISSAAKYGVIEAILYENILHWLRVNKANGVNINDGKVWTYNSVQAYSRLFPYLTPKQIRRAIESLVKQNAIIKSDYNKANYDKTSWYSIPDESILAIGPEGQAISPKGQMDVPEKANRSAQKGEPIPDINQIINSDVNTHTARDGLEYGMIPPELVEPIKRYVKATNFKPNIGYIATHITIAVGRTSLETVRNAISNAAAKAEKPGCNLDYIPKLSNLLSNTAKLIEWSDKAEPQIASWWSGLSETDIIDRLTSLLRYGIEIPQELEKWIPQAQQILSARLAS
jgi:hypothetical protein